MKNIQDFKQFNEQSIYSANWKEAFDEVKCNTLDLEPGDEFKMTDGKSSYKNAFYRGNQDDLFYFSYEPDGIVYKIPKHEMKTKFVEKI